ncbi:MAG: hypothetical protein ACC657_09650 [Thiohalomonadales bacterium]
MYKQFRILSVVLFFSALTKFALAQPVQGQWPPINGNYTGQYQQRYAQNFPSRQYANFGSSWQSNYVSSNYNPYINQTQVGSRLMPQQRYNYLPGTAPNGMFTPYANTGFGYASIMTPSWLPVYGNPYMNTLPMTLPFSMMPYNPWFPGWSY